MSSPRDLYDEWGEDVHSLYTDRYTDAVDSLYAERLDTQPWLRVDWDDVYLWDNDVATGICNDPGMYKTAFEMALADLAPAESTTHDDVTVWFYNFPDERTLGVDDCRATHSTEFISVTGQIGRIGRTRFKAEELVFRCGLCGAPVHVPQPDTGIQNPNECANCERKGPFRLDTDESVFTDHLALELTQPVEETAGGDGETLEAILTGEVETWFSHLGLSSGARVTVNGVLCVDETSGEKDGMFEPYLDVLSLEPEEQDFEELDTDEHLDTIEELAARDDIYQQLIDSLAPDIRGGEKLADIKLGLMLALFGGFRRMKPDGTHIRGDSHVLLIGDPSTGKSSLLDAVVEIAPRSVRASGRGASAAGLTAAAVKNESNSSFGDGGWVLEAGALALANGGVAAVDEIGRMDGKAVESIHGALETQVITVNKAGINAEVPARTTLVAAGNPKYDRFDMYEPVYEQIELDSALWSRFDLAFILYDIQDEDRDRDIAEGKVQTWQESAEVARGDLPADEADSITPAIDHEVLRAYIAHAKRTVAPVVTDAAGEAVVDYYTDIRQEGDSDTPALAARKLEGIRRLSEASARVRLSEQVTVEDVERAKRVIGRSLSDVGINEDGELDADIMETGVSAPQRERVKNVKQLAAELKDGDHHPSGVPKDVLVEAACDRGMDRSDVVHEIEKLLQQGELYEPVTDVFRPT